MNSLCYVVVYWWCHQCGLPNQPSLAGKGVIIIIQVAPSPNRCRMELGLFVKPNNSTELVLPGLCSYEMHLAVSTIFSIFHRRYSKTSLPMYSRRGEEYTTLAVLFNNENGDIKCVFISPEWSMMKAHITLCKTRHSQSQRCSCCENIHQISKGAIWSALYLVWRTNSKGSSRLL